MADVRIKVNRDTLTKLLNSPSIVADLNRRGHAIAAAADSAANDPGGHRVASEKGKRRARVAVITATPKAMYKEAVGRTLTSSLGAGRR